MGCIKAPCTRLVQVRLIYLQRVRGTGRLMDWDDFEIGFWHPFGLHAGESRHEILVRKQNEVAQCGYTYWSFQYRQTTTLEAWRNILEHRRGVAVYVLCSDSPAARDPQGERSLYTEFRDPGSTVWRTIPDGVSIPHPGGTRHAAAAFVVRRVFAPSELHGPPDFGVEWFRASSGEWRRGPLPTRGEYLVRRGGSSRLRPVYTVLELERPFIVELRVRSGDG